MEAIETVPRASKDAEPKKTPVEPVEPVEPKKTPASASRSC